VRMLAVLPWPDDDGDDTGGVLDPRARMEARQAFRPTDTCPRRCERELAKVTRGDGAVAPPQLARHPLEGRSDRLTVRAAGCGERVAHLRGRGSFELRDRGSCDVSARAAAVAVAGCADALADLRSAPAHAVAELDHARLGVERVDAVVLAAREEVLHGSPGLPGVRLLLDLDDERAVDHRAVHER